MPAAAPPSPSSALPPLPTPAVEIRPPWPDELPRLHDYLSAAFVRDRAPWTQVAVAGAVERLVAAAAFSVQTLGDGKTAAWLTLRVNDRPDRDALGAALLERALPAAWAAGAGRLILGQTFDEASSLAAALRAKGFTVEGTHEVYETPSRPLWERTRRLHDRMRARGWIPAEATLTTLQPAVLAAAERFIADHMPGSASTLAMETAAYRPEHSVALLLRGEVKGVLLCRRHGPVASIGLRLVAPELRGGIAWANLMLLHASLGAGVATGLEISRFELNPALHEDTRQLAQLLGATHVGRRLLLGISRPDRSEDWC